MDGATFTHDIITLSLTDFHDSYQHLLPCFVTVTQGYCGDNELETLGCGEVLRIHSSVQQKRVIAVDARQRTLSIPGNYPLKFNVQGKGRKLNGRLNELLSKITLPINVQIDDGRPVSFSLNRAEQTVKSLGILNLKEVYEERYFLANAITGGHPIEHPVIIPLYLKDLMVSMVTGIKGKSGEDWANYKDKVNAVMQKVTIPRDSGLREIAVYSPQSVTNSDNIYDSIEPASYIYTNWDERLDGTPSDPARDAPTVPPKPCKPAVPLPFGLPPREDGQPPVLPRRSSVPLFDSHSQPSSGRTHAYVNDIQRAAVEPFKHIAQAAAEKAGQIARPGAKPSVVKAPSLKAYTIDEIGQKLKELKLTKYVESFRKQGVDGELASEFDESILQDEFKFSKFDSLKFMKFLKTGHIAR